MRKKPNKNNKNRSVYTYIMLIIIGITFLTSGYSAFVDNLAITDIVTHIRAHKEIRINGVRTNSGYVSDLEYDHDRIINSVYIPANSSITYNVTVTNLGNVPVAVSNVSFISNGETINGLSSDINPNEYKKICNDDNCMGPITKELEITITNNTSETISKEISAILTFSQVYKVTYEGNKIGEVIEGNDFSYTFETNPPANISKKSGESDAFSYADNKISITNVRSDIELINAYTIYYNGSVLGYAAEGSPFTKNLEPEFPATVTKESGTCDSFNYQNHVLTIGGVRSDISVTGTLGKVAITGIRYISSHNVVDPTDAAHQPQFTGDDLNVSFNVIFRKDEGSEYDDFQITYEVDLTNTYYNDYIFRGFDFHPTITASADSDTAQLTLTPVGINNGDKVASETTKTFRVTLNLEANNIEGEYTTGGTTQVDTTENNTEETGEITATISPNTGDLKNNQLVPFTVKVTSTYENEREFKLLSSNSNLEVVDSNGNAIGTLTVPGKSTEKPYTVYIKVASGATFVNDTDTTTIYLSTNGKANKTIDTLTFDVKKYDKPDTTKVTVGNVKIAMHKDSATTPTTTGQIDVTWDRIDVGGTSVINYTVQLYKSGETTPTATKETGSSIRTVSFTGLDNGTYFAVVYGLDKAQNSGEEYASSTTTTANGFASASSETPFKWRFNVDTSGITSNLTIGGNNNLSVAYLEQEYSLTVTAKGQTRFGDNMPPDDLTVQMGTGDNIKKLTKGTDYSYSTNNKTGTLKINKNIIKDDISISGDHNPGCLIEGTKILLANGRYKNIENIDYDDLLMVYSYEIGSFVKEYPIWIERKGLANKYQVNTFSDGTTLKTYGYHGVFESELNRFVSVDNPQEFHIGSKITKMNSDKSTFETVTVTNIEEKNEQSAYYHVVSTRYYNVIANDILTTDGTVVLSNLYGFNTDMTWPEKIRNQALKDVYSYNELEGAIPYYMFKGMRAEEGKILSNYGLDLGTFKGYLIKNQNNPEMLKQPIQMFNKNAWMVTTSLDNVTDLNKSQYLRVEGSTYSLPNVYDKNFIGWINYSDNIMYQPGDKITVYHGMHFEAIYQ